MMEVVHLIRQKIQLRTFMTVNLIRFFESLNYKGEANEFIGVQLEFNEVLNAGNIRLIAPRDNAYSFRYRIEVRVKAKNSSGEFANYTIASGAANYILSPTKGNAIDITWTAREIKGVQLRIFP